MKSFVILRKVCTIKYVIMKNIVFVPLMFVLAVLPVYFFSSCSTVPLSGRSQLNLIPKSEILAMSFSNYDEFMRNHQLSQNQQKVDMVKRVGNRIAAAVEKYMNDNGMASRLEGYKWEFHLVEEDVPNAWCMPGGKVAIYTGILPYTKDETGLAVVMGHEIAHAVARHGNERMSQALLIETGGLALSAALDEKPQRTKDLYMMAYGVGATVGVQLPYSRAHENEADHLGLIFMAMADYNPREAVSFWQRMQQAGGAKPPEFLSTHPADQTRIGNIQNHMPEALSYYKK